MRRRARVLALPAGLMLALGAAGAAAAHKSEGGTTVGATKPSSTSIVQLRELDWFGPVTIGYETTSDGRSTAYFLYSIKLPNACDPGGTGLRPDIRIGASRQFSYSGPGLTVAGHVIGSLAHPGEIAGLATVHTPGCTSGPWWFGTAVTP